MTRRSITVAAAALFVLFLATAAMAADPFAGTWKLNVAKSTFNSGPPEKSEMATFTAQDNGLKLVVDGIDGDGKALHGGWAAKFDGKDYPMTGNPNADTIAIKRIDTNAFSELFKKAGKKVASTRLVVSKDGKTITRTVKEKNAKGQDVSSTYILEKQ